MTQITITQPDDWHIHLRDQDMLRYTVADVARYFSRAIVMPNLNPPVLNCADADAYRSRIEAQIPAEANFRPLMTLYLTDNTRPEEILLASANPHIHAVKYYPAGATTNSDSGVTGLEKCFATLEKMAELGVPLLMHGEVTHSNVDIYDREKLFIERELIPLIARLPELKIVLEHITTADAAAFVTSGSANIGATITPQHLLCNRNDMLVGGIRPHLYCLPILKRREHQEALLQAATSANPKFFLGTDSAPHAKHTKETDCGCAGCYSAATAIELYAEAFDSAGALERLEGFASHFGPDFYGLPRNNTTITLIKESWRVPNTIPMADDCLIPLLAGKPLAWKVRESSHLDVG